MLELAKKLIPDIEENMPAAVREAFEAGKVKSIFRTGTDDINPETGMRKNIRGTTQRPSSTYFLLDDGRAARYGVDDTGTGWMGARASVPKVIANQDDPFVFDRILFGDGDEALKLGANVEEVLKSGSGITSDPVVGKNIYETFSEDGKITKFHGGNAVKDVYKRDGTATFFEDAADPIYNKKMSPITTAIDDLDFVERQGKELKVKLPKLSGGKTAADFPVQNPKSFKTSQGSVYTYGADGRVTRQKSVSGSTMEASSSSFDKTVFLPEEDLSSAKAGLGRGLRPTESGQFRGLDYDPSKMDKQKFMDLRFKQKKAFDEAYTSAGGTISERLITPETQPKIGLHPLEYNLGDNKFHAGNEVTEIVAQDGTVTRIDPKASVVPEAAPAPTTARIDSTPPPSGSTMKPVGTEIPADEVTRSVKPRAVSESRLRGLIEHARGTGPEAENAKKMLAKLGYQDVAAAENGLAAMEAHSRVAAEGAQATSEATIDDAVKGGAKITSDPPAAGAKVATTAAGAGGAKPPTSSAKTASKLADSLDLAKKAVKGHTNARNLLIAGAASIVGAGAYMRKRKNNIETEYEQY